MMIAGYLLVGCIAGLLAGLFGVGGGIIVVPVLVAMFHLEQISPEVLIPLAIGTSVATICLTSLSSAWTHAQQGHVNRGVLLRVVPGTLIGSWLGAFLAVYLPGDKLLQLLGVLNLLIAVKLWLGARPRSSRKLFSTPVLLPVAGLGIGGLSALFGIGGGIFSVPLLRSYGENIKMAIGTSAAIGLPMALMGTIAHITANWGNPHLPQWATGDIYWPAFLGVVITSIPCARLSARLATKIDPAILQKLFALFLLVVGVKFLLI